MGSSVIFRLPLQTSSLAATRITSMISVPLLICRPLLESPKYRALRFVALTNVSATCAMAGKIADIGGVNDALYSGCNTCAFLDLANNQCPTALSNLCQTCVGFQTGVTPKPTIDTPVKAAQPVVTGTAIPNATVFIDLFNSSNVTKAEHHHHWAGTGCVVCSWTATFGANLAPGDIISARAKSITGCQSAGVSSGCHGSHCCGKRPARN